MILKAATDYGLALGRSVLIGNNASDIEAGKASGVGHCVGLIDHAGAMTGVKPDLLVRTLDEALQEIRSLD
jgi:histidinol phosphatase-like enzyme